MEKGDPETNHQMRINDAIIHAIKCHDGQTRHGEEIPYVIHCIRVLNNILFIESHGLHSGKFSPDMLDDAKIVAVLHDILEDTFCSEKEIEELYGKTILNYIKELTLDNNLSKGEQREDLIRKSKDFSMVAKLVKLADRLDNLSSMDMMSVEFQKRYTVESEALLKNLKGTCAYLEDKIQRILDEYSHNFKEKENTVAEIIDQLMIKNNDLYKMLED